MEFVYQINDLLTNEECQKYINMFDKKKMLKILMINIENIIVFSLMIKNWLIDYIKKLNHTFQKRLKKYQMG